MRTANLMVVLTVVSTFIICHSTLVYAFPPAPTSQTGQKSCYNAAGAATACAGTGQDGEFQNGVVWPDQRFTDSGNGEVTDNLTGLGWAKGANLIKTRDPSFDADGTTSDGAVTWQHALDYVRKLNSEDYLGHNDWRLPNRVELESLVTAENWFPSLPAGHPFTSVTGDCYWSSSTSALDTSKAWDVCVGQANTTGRAKSYNYYVWPVRAGQPVWGQPAPFAASALPRTGQTTSYAVGDDGDMQIGVAWPSPRFTDNNDQTMLDNLTGLIWTKNADITGPCVPYPFDAIAYVKCLNSNKHLGFNDWTLPNTKELESLINIQEGNPATWLMAQGFTTVRSIYWSSTASNGNHKSPQGVYMDDGDMADNVGGYLAAWPVRSGQFWGLNTFLVKAVSKFDTVVVGSAAPTHEVVINNRSIFTQANAAVAITGANGAEFSIATGGSKPCANTTSLTLAAGASCTLTLTFAPTSSGAKTASLDFTANGATNSIHLTGTSISTIFGTVTDQSNGRAVAGATITLNTAETATSGADGSYTFGNLPAGNYSISVAKTVYQTTGKNNIVVTATSPAKADILLPTSGTLKITTSNFAWTSPGAAFSSRVMVGGGTAPYSFSKTYGPLPTGLTLDSATGTISGTPTDSGSYIFGIGVTDSVAGYSEKEFTIESVGPLLLTTESLLSGQQGTAYSATMSATGGIPFYTFTLSGGKMPVGTILISDGRLVGIPREAGSFSFNIKVTDSIGVSYERPYNFTVSAAAALSFDTPVLPAGYVGSDYTSTLSATGGVAPLTYGITGTPPAGLTLNRNTGTLSGTPAAAGLINLTFTVTDNAYPTPHTAVRTVALSTLPALTIVTMSLPSAIQKAAYNSTLERSGGAQPFTWSLASGALPSGLTLDTTSGALSGRPVNCGSFDITAQLADSASPPKIVQQPLNLNIACSNDYVLSGSTGVAGATVTLSGTSAATTTTDSLGNYSFGPLTNGSYTVTPAKTQSLFTPDSRTVTINDLDTTLLAFSSLQDFIAPTVTAFSLPTATESLAVTVSSFEASDNIGGSGLNGYLLTESATVPSVSASGWTLSAPSAYTFQQVPDGIANSTRLYAWVKDAVGNISNSAVTTTVITLPDVTKPVITGFTVPATVLKLDVPIVTCTATDNVDVTGYLITDSPTTPSALDAQWSTLPPLTYAFTTSGLKTLYAWAKDASGNISTSLPANVYVVSKPGDGDGNGTVSIAEVQIAINMFLGLKQSEPYVDTDGVGGVSIAEVQKVINAFLGL